MLGGVLGISVLVLAHEGGKPKKPTTAQPELDRARKLLDTAKRKLAKNGHYSCCTRPSCDLCAHEADCPCGRDLASTKPKGVCGHCVDGWKSGRGVFQGIPVDEVKLAPMEMTGVSGMAMVRGDGQLASGTSQVPGAVSIDMLMGPARGWNWMLHGTAFGVHTNQTGPRGRDKLFSTNWLMPSATRKVGPGYLTLRSMLSLEPATITNRRYPLLFQLGETAYGVPIINGQHPYELFMLGLISSRADHGSVGGAGIHFRRICSP